MKEYKLDWVALLVAGPPAIDLVIQVYTNKQMLVRDYLDNIREGFLTPRNLKKQ